MHKLKILSLMSLALVSGCSMAPDYEKPTVAMNDTYLNAQYVDGVTTNKQDPNEHTWWSQFNDEKLNQLVARAQQQNINLKMASQRIQQAQAYQEAVSSLKVPTISVGMMYSKYQVSENDPLMGGLVSDVAIPAALGGGTTQLLDQNGDSTILGANVTWELDLFGRIKGMDKAAKIRVEQAKMMTNGVNTLITADVIDNYLQYRGTQERLKIAERNIDEQEQSLKLVESLNKYGYGSSLDVATAKTAVARVKASLPMLDNARMAHLNRLALLLGENVHTLEQSLGDGALPKVNKLVPTGVPSDLLQRRPDIVIANYQMEAENQEVGSAIANRYPRFFLTGSPGLSADHFDDVFDSSSTTWGAGAGVSWTIFDGGRGKAMVAMKEASFKQAAMNYQYTVNKAFNEVETTLRVYGNSQDYVRYVDNANQEAQKAVDKSESLYRSGLIPHLAVLDAQRQKNSIQDAEVVARLNTVSSVVMLHKALGGDWVIPTQNDQVHQENQGAQ